MKIGRALPHPAFGHLLPLKTREKATTSGLLPFLTPGEGARRPDEEKH
jgi:hypothetical protein